MRHLSILRIGYALALAFILYLALAPHPPTDGFFWDKLNHMAAFFALAFGARILWPRLSALRLFAQLAILGGGIEILQLAMQLGREGDWLDFLADMVATIAGMVAGTLARRMLSRRS